MSLEFTYKHRVAFSETDMAGIVHFSNFFRIMENAEHAFFRSFGASVTDKHDGRRTGWPRVHASCDFLKPIYYNEEITVVLTIDEVRSSSVCYTYSILKESGVEAAKGKMVTAFAEFDEESSKLKAALIPDNLRSHFTQ